jgi:hypothetical protein
MSSAGKQPDTMQAGTADQITHALIDWIGVVLPGVNVSARSLAAHEREDGVDVRLAGLSPRAPPRVPAPPSIVELEYLITLRMSDVFNEQRLLADLLLAAIDQPEYEIVTARSAAELCVTLGIPPATGFVLKTPLLRPRVVKRAPLVRFPLQVHTADLCVLEGKLLGPGDVPIAGAVISTNDRLSRTDANGNFHIPGVPDDGKAVALHVRARGIEAQMTAAIGEFNVLRLALEV